VNGGGLVLFYWALSGIELLLKVLLNFTEMW